MAIFIGGCTDERQTANNSAVTKTEVVRVIIDRGDESTASGEITDSGDIARLEKVLQEAKPAGEEILYTADFYRNLTLVYDDESTHGVSFNQGGGYVFVDQRDGQIYTIDSAARSVVQQIVNRAEQK
jgi:hypothetical protein